MTPVFVDNLGLRGGSQGFLKNRKGYEEIRGHDPNFLEFGLLLPSFLDKRG
jgi:hypothetical protein